MSDFVMSAKYFENTQGKSSHYHDCHQILYITDGCARVRINDKEYIAKGGYLVLISRLEQHSIEILSDTYKRYALRISPKPSESADTEGMLLSVLVNRPENFCHAVDLSSDNEKICDLLEKIIDEKSNGYPLGDYMSNLLFSELLTYVFRRYPKLFANYENRSIKLVWQIQNFFNDNYQETYTLSSIAAKYHISQSHLSHLFKRVAGMSVMDYLQSCRIAAAKKYLAKTDYTVSEISEKCGIGDSSNFSRSFKRITGLSPLKFRQKYKIGND